DAVRPLPAQTDDSGVVPLSVLVPHVDAQLDDLVRRTFSADSAGADGAPVTGGPAVPADVVSALEPWGQVSVVASLPQFVQPATEQPVRSSVFGAMGGGEARPGTPPPAPPVRRPSSGRIARGAAVGSGAGYAAFGQQPYPTAPVTPQGNGAGTYPQPGADGPMAGTAAMPPAGPPHGGYQPTNQAPYQPADQAQFQAASPHAPVPPPPPENPQAGFASTPVPRRRGVNPTPIVLGVVVAAVVGGAIWAAVEALNPLEPPIQTNPSATAEAGGPAGEPTGAAEGEGANADDEPAEPEVRPVIDSGDKVDPFSDDDSLEHPEAVELAYDADPSTFWYTTTYHNNPVFGGFKEGAGYVVQLREPAPVSKIELNTNSTGGAWEIRNTTADDPTGGTELGSGSFEQTTELTLEEPEVLTSFVIWITELPRSEGQPENEFRLELTEIVVS
ncbi:MAG: hypothetical protein M3217_06855, partial [Actinomycetota bacterium]|nr:hypothetical protein [Actinomycetota bacterium]